MKLLNKLYFCSASKPAEVKQPFCLILRMCCTIIRLDIQKGQNSELSRYQVFSKCLIFSYSGTWKCVHPDLLCICCYFTCGIFPRLPVRLQSLYSGIQTLSYNEINIWSYTACGSCLVVPVCLHHRCLLTTFHLLIQAKSVGNAILRSCSPRNSGKCVQGQDHGSTFTWSIMQHLLLPKAWEAPYPTQPANLFSILFSRSTLLPLHTERLASLHTVWSGHCVNVPKG